jgi:hypothetical protein
MRETAELLTLQRIRKYSRANAEIQIYSSYKYICRRDQSLRSRNNYVSRKFLPILIIQFVAAAASLNQAFDPRIVNGEDAKWGEIPYQVCDVSNVNKKREFLLEPQ